MRQTKLLKAARLADTQTGVFYAAMRQAAVPERKLEVIKGVIHFNEHAPLYDRNVRVLALLFLNEMSLAGDL
jgi:hypothetical protein